MSDEEWDHPVFATRGDFEQRMFDLLAVEEEHSEGEGFFYMSFASSEEGFLGGLYMSGRGELSAIQKAWDLGLNPGGEVMSWGPLPNMQYFPREYLFRLLTEDEVREAERLHDEAIAERPPDDE